MERITYTEAEDKVEQSTWVAGSLEEMGEQLEELSFAPPYIVGLLAIKIGADLLRMSEHSCADCSNPACFGKPQHQQIIRELLLDKTLPALNEQIKELQEQITLAVYHMGNCECEYCIAKDKKNAAPFN